MFGEGRFLFWRDQPRILEKSFSQFPLEKRCIEEGNGNESFDLFEGAIENVSKRAVMTYADSFAR